MATCNILPYSCVYIDAEFKEIIEAARRCLFSSESPEARAWITSELSQLFTSPANANHVLPCLSVRTGFDLFCQAAQFARGSEIIMSAINIPSMALIIERHGLVVVPWDVDMETLSPKHHLLPHLITERTVAVVLAHIYGTVLDVSELLATCHHHGILFVEDCAEAFGGLNYLGHRYSDLALFSFGVIKFRTAFGGAMAKVRDDALYRRMVCLQESFPAQTNSAYLRKLLKYAGVYMLLNAPRLMTPCMALGKMVGWDYQTTVVDYLRNFKGDEFESLRRRPSMALLSTMRLRLSSVTEAEFELTRAKARYVIERLIGHVMVVGLCARERNYWLFPVVVQNAKQFCLKLNRMGVDAYRGATQLDVIIPKNLSHQQFCVVRDPTLLLSDVATDLAEGRNTPFASSSSILENLSDSSAKQAMHCGNAGSERQPWKMCCHQFPSEAKYLIDHVVYLPVHKHVPYKCLDLMCEKVKVASRECRNDVSPSTHAWLGSKL